MIYLTTLFYYGFFASSVLIYGVGLNKTVQTNFWHNKSLLYFIKAIITMLLGAIISWFICDKLLVPLKLAQLYPIFCFIVYVCLSLIVEFLFTATARHSPTEFIVSYLAILLSVSESTSFLNTLIICFSIICSMLVLIPFVYSFRKRNLEDTSKTELYMSKIFIFFAILILLISSWDVMWINSEVLK